MKCSIFRCQRFGSKRCCNGCAYHDQCDNPCLNSPDVCGNTDKNPKVIIRAISLWQPWASLKAENIKRYETRGLEIAYRGQMAIHAAKMPIKRAVKYLSDETRAEVDAIYPNIASLPVGCIVGIGNLVACHEITEEFIAGLTEREKLLGAFSVGRYAWEFEDMTALKEPIPANGKQGIWRWEMGGNS